MDRIVVGVDGSEGSQRALAWAAQEARLHGATIDAVMVVPPTYVYPGATARLNVAGPPSREDEKDARLALEASVREVREEQGSGVDINERVLAGSAARQLTAVAEDADLLVVGSRGLGGFRGLLLGSVSQQAVSHARCPVSVVPSADSGG
jgi:nucleotide-binding universal stress UspA family protein